MRVKPKCFEEQSLGNKEPESPQTWVGQCTSSDYPHPDFWLCEKNKLPICLNCYYVFVSCSVVSDSASHGGQLPRLLCPWNSPGKNTGKGNHFLLQGIFPTQRENPGLMHCRQILYHSSHQEAATNWMFCLCLVTKSYLTLCNPMDCSLPVHGILQASILEWVAISFSRGSS